MVQVHVRAQSLGCGQVRKVVPLNSHKYMKYAFIAVLYKTPKNEVERFKKEVEKLSLPDFKIFFWNNSIDNKGYAYGINKAMAMARKYDPDIYVFVNTDIALGKLDKKRLYEASKHFDLWGYAMKQHGKTYYSGAIEKIRLSARLSQKKPDKRFAEVDFVPGPLIVVKKKVVEEVGDWDERFFLYYEDVDYCMRAKKAGFSVGVDTESTYHHFENSISNPKKERLLAVSRLKFLLKHGTMFQKLYELLRLPKTLTEGRPFVANFLTLNVSSFINKILNFVLFIFLVRFLSVKDYGFYTLAWAHVGLLQPFLDFGTTSYGLVYLDKKNVSQVSSLFSLRVVLAFLIFVATLTLAFILRYDKNLFLFIFLVSFTLFSNALSGSLLIFSSLKEKLILPSILSMGFNTALIGVLIVSIIRTKSLPVVFIIVFIFYNLYSLLNFYFLKKEVDRLHFKIEIKKWSKILRKSIVFLFISLFAGLYFKLDVFLLNFIKGPEDVGIYSAGYKFLEAFLFIAASYNIVSTPVMSRLRKQAVANLRIKVRKDVFYLTLIGIVTAVSVFTLSPYLSLILFRSEYKEAINVLRVVIGALPFILVTSVFFNSLYVLGKARYVMWLFIIQTVINVGLNLIFIPKYSYMASSYITFFGEVINTLIASALLFTTLRNENLS